MERPEEDCPVNLSGKIGDHVEVGIEGRIVFATRQEVVHDIPRQVVRRIAREIIACVRGVTITARLLHHREIRHVCGQRDNGPLRDILIHCVRRGLNPSFRRVGK